MRFRQQPKEEEIDALCQRACSFAICRQAGEREDDFFMAADGEENLEYIGLKLRRKAGFMLAHYMHETLIYAIPEQLDILPPANRFPKFNKQVFDEGPVILTREQYAERYNQYIQFLDNKKLEKIVLARCEDIEVSHFSPARAYARACELYPRVFNALVHTPYGTWICSTPELLIKGRGDKWMCMALAGTQPKGGVWSEKNKREQECVSQHTRDVLRSLELHYKESPTTTLNAGEIEHLCTLFHIDMPKDELTDFLDVFPPTPAVCGYPLDIAKLYHGKYPDINRGYYSGFFGPYRPQGETALYVVLRCMQVRGKTCRLYAGGGMLPESNQEAEWQETCLKMQSMRRLIEEQMS